MHVELERRDLKAEYADMTTARKAIEALEFAGLDARQISLKGGRAREAARATSTKNTTTLDGRIVRRVALRGFAGAVAGSLAGALIGLLVAGTGLGWFGSSIPAAVASFGIGGLIVGALIGAYSAVTTGTAWELTFARTSVGPVVVSVHTDTRDAGDRAEHVLREHQAMRVSKA